MLPFMHCFAVTFAGEDTVYLKKILGFVFMFALINVVTTTSFMLTRFPTLKLRPTYPASLVHATGSSFAPVAYFCGFVGLNVWHEFSLPLSMAYFITDFFVYCIPNKDVLMVIHHLVMIVCHITVGTEIGATCSGGGDIELVRQLSIAGYMAELPNILLTTRWIIMKTNALGNYPVMFALHNLVLLLTFIGTRLFWFYYVIVYMCLPTYDYFVDAGLFDVFCMLMGGYIVIFIMSIGWLVLLLRGGLKAYFVFDPKSTSVRGLTVERKQD
eukprot:m.262268 g.262268  ORF g.262268 m.262268 type:complete len:270 (-) comp45002_c0_seq1:10-819(-)